MGNAWQIWVVLALVLLAAGYSVWYALPGKYRKRLGAVHHSLATGPACGACSSCGKCAGPTPDVSSTPPVVSSVAVQPLTFHRKP